MNPYKLTFKLKQHTPIIHFQHDQTGATLRATELKPKLDKFILTKLGNGNYEQGIETARNNGWLIGDGEHPALDYKVRVESPTNVDYYLPLANKLNTTRYPNRENNARIGILNHWGPLINNNFNFSYLYPTPFFANQDKIKFNDENVNENESKFDELRFALLTHEEITIDIASYNMNKIAGKTLLETIKENLIDFFLITNFGARQNKGFGSFTVISINGNTNTHTDNDLQKFFIKVSENQFTNLQETFSFINKEYQLLKSGINIPYGKNPVYKKSELFKYFIKKNIRWEKRYIKQQLNNNGINLLKTHDPIDYDNSGKRFYNSYNDRQHNEYQYVRALLGLAEHFEYQLTNRSRIKIKIVNENDEIERFQSPIFMKVIDKKIYLGINKTYKNIEGKQFKFFNDNNLLGELMVPTNFDLSDFINNHISTNWINV